jgi:hypothetical protein
MVGIDIVANVNNDGQNILLSESAAEKSQLLWIKRKIYTILSGIP